jgi:hypothetical protein
MAVLDWAQTLEAAGTLRRQKLLVFHCVNPDGAERDSYHNAQDINVYHSYRADGACTTPEAQAVWDVLMREVPEAYVDCHGLAGGSMHELVLPTLGRHCSADNVIANVIANDMTRAAEAVGFPQQTPHLIECWTHAQPPPLQKLLLERFGTIGYTLEMNEGYLTTAQQQASGLARLKALFDYGDRRSFGYPHEGYPLWIGGGPMHGVVPYGRTAAERRAHRARLVPFLTRIHGMNRRPDTDGICLVQYTIAEGDAPTPEGFASATSVYPWCEVEEVTFAGQPIKHGGWPTGYEVIESHCRKQILVSLGCELPTGESELAIRYHESRADV